MGTRRGGYTGFQIACINGRLDLAKFLIQKAIEFDIELNANNALGYKAFHLACMFNQSKIVEMLIENSNNNHDYKLIMD